MSAPPCRACRRLAPTYTGLLYTAAECRALRSDALPRWLRPSTLQAEVRRALQRRAGRAWTVAESVALRKSHEIHSTPEQRETYRRLLEAIEEGPPSTPAARARELDYHLARWADHDGLTLEDRC